MSAGFVLEDTDLGKLEVGWRSSGITNASLPESDADVSPSQVDGTARTGLADIHAHHASHEARRRACNPVYPHGEGNRASGGVGAADVTREEPTAFTPGRMSCGGPSFEGEFNAKPDQNASTRHSQHCFHELSLRDHPPCSGREHRQQRLIDEAQTGKQNAKHE